MYKVRSGLVLGFHGCDASVQRSVISGKIKLKPSDNPWDWLGNGTYFWEYSPQRALEYSKILKKHPERCSQIIKKPAVIGAIISLGKCLDLLNHENLSLLKEIHRMLVFQAKQENRDLPENRKVGNKAFWTSYNKRITSDKQFHYRNSLKGNNDMVTTVPFKIFGYKNQPRIVISGEPVILDKSWYDHLDGIRAHYPDGYKIGVISAGV